MEQLIFETPTEKMEEEVLAFMQQFYDAGETVVHGSAGLDVYKNYGTWMEYLRKIDAGATDVFMPSIIYLARTGDGDIAGILDIRPDLPEEKSEFGHLGYSVAPRFRRRGYATEMVAYGIYRLRKAGRGDILAACYADNTGSRRALEKNHFVVLNEKKDGNGKTVINYIMRRSEENNG